MSGIKERRQRALLDLVQSRPVHTQQEMMAALAALGLHVTQATVSRDIHDLALVRTPRGYRASGGPAAYRDHVLSVTVVAHLAVVKTPPGAAMMVARALDEAALPGLVGTVAGDDTIMAVLRDRASGRTLERVLVGEK